MKRMIYMLGCVALILSLTACDLFGGGEATPSTSLRTSSTTTADQTTNAVTTVSSVSRTVSSTVGSTGTSYDSTTKHTTVEITTTTSKSTTSKKSTTTKNSTTTKKATTTKRSTTTKKTTTTAVSSSNYSSEVLRLVNIERQNAGLDPLIYYPVAQAAADTRAAEIHELWSHTRPNGESCFTALDEIGVHYRAAGENIAMGYRTPAAVVEGWMNSSGHRANILSEDFTHIVISFNNYGWVQLFLTPR